MIRLAPHVWLTSMCVLLPAFGCGGRDAGGLGPTAPSPLQGLVRTASAQSAVFVGAADIAHCNQPGAEATARLLDSIGGTVFVAGDNAYMNGSEADYRDCYHPTWGRHRSRTRPVPGNHEYQTPGASGYFEYFGASAGPRGLGYYSYMVGSWQVIAVNSEIPSSEGSPQWEWLRQQLAANPAECAAVYWHRPLFSSGPNGPNRDMQPVWQLLHDARVELVVNGHDHIYERFAPQDPDGRADPVRGIRQFTVGTGGAPPYHATRLAANSEAVGSAWGVTKFTFLDGSYRWEFVPAEGHAFRDSGGGSCH